MPAPPTFSGDVELRERSGFGGDASVRMRKTAQKTVHNGEMEFPRHDSRFIHGQANLLLMMPAFGELARRIKPVRGLLFAGPAHGKHGSGERIKRLVVFGAFPRRCFHSRNQLLRMQLAVLADAFRVERVDQRYELRGGKLLGVFSLVAVPRGGKLADLRVEQMRGNVFHLPSGSEGLLFPIFRSEPAQKLDQLRFQLWKKLRGENRLQRFAFGAHGRYFILVAPGSPTFFLPGPQALPGSMRRRRFCPLLRGATGAPPASSGLLREFRWRERGSLCRIR